jgi:hypothetical protein
MGMGGKRHAPTALPPGKIRCPLYRRLVRPQGRSGRVRKMALLIQHARRMRRIILLSASCLAVLYLFTLSHKTAQFPGEKLLDIKYVCRIPYEFEKLLILKVTRWDIFINVHTSSCRVPVILVRFWRNSKLFGRFFFCMKLKYQILWKSVHWESNCSTRKGGHTRHS